MASTDGGASTVRVAGILVVETNAAGGVSAAVTGVSATAGMTAAAAAAAAGVANCCCCSDY